MERILYIGPDLTFLFQKPHDNEVNAYHVIIKSVEVKLCSVVTFEKKRKDNNLSVKMFIAIGSVAGPLVGIDQLNKAINCLTVNRETAAEVCSQAFLNGFLDAEF